MTESDLDHAIDVAVREMMRVESTSDVRTQVLQRLQRTEQRVFTWPRLAVAAAAALLLAFILLRAPRPTPVIEMTATPPVATPIAASPEAPATAPESATASPQASRDASNELEHNAVDAMQFDIAPTVPSLAPIEPLVVEPPRSRPIEPDAIVIAPLPEIPDVRVEPLSPVSGPQ